MKTVAKVVLITSLWLIVISNGALGSGDTYLRLQIAHAWWTGTEEVSTNYQPKERGEVAAGVLGVGGKRYIAYELGQPLLMLPGDWVATEIFQWFPQLPLKNFLQPLIVNFLIFIPLNIVTVVACFWFLRLFDFDDQIAGLTSITWLMGTTVLHYAQVHQQNNQVLLFVILGYASALAFVQRDRPGFAFLSGLAIGGALLVRATSIIHALTVLLFLVGCVAYHSRNKLKVSKVVGFWVAGFIPLFLLGKAFDYVRYGSFWASGQSLPVKQLNTDPFFSDLPALPANYPFTNPPEVGILGVLFSPAKSIFIYDPLLLPCLLLGILLWKKLSPYMQWYLITGIFNLGLFIVLTSRLNFWHGDWAWGARYHVTSVHLLLIPLLALFMQRLISKKGLITCLMRVILTVAILVQIASVTMSHNLEVYQSRIGLSKTYPVYQSRLEFRLGQRLTNIACQINSSISEECINESLLRALNPRERRRLKNANELAFLPFRFSRMVANSAENSIAKPVTIIVFTLWLSILALAVWTTVWYTLSE
jgi:hypothetical protein